MALPISFNLGGGGPRGSCRAARGKCGGVVISITKPESNPCNIKCVRPSCGLSAAHHFRPRPRKRAEMEVFGEDVVGYLWLVVDELVAAATIADYT